MKGFDYAKNVFHRVPPARLLHWFVPEVRQLLRGAYELGVSAATLHNWVRQDRIDRGEISGLTSRESVELARASMRIRGLELEVKILRRASKIFEEGHHDPKEFTR
jgi:transposase-like protein